MTWRPRVSVLLPTRNGGPFLVDAVESILRQTLADLELIVIDDGSRDGAVQGLPRDDRLRITPSAGQGIVDALNTGIRLSRGRYIARMDGDDIALPARLKRQIALMEAQPNLGITGAQVEIFSQSGQLGGGFRHYQDWINSLLTPADIRREIFVESPLPHPTAVFRADLLHRLGGYRHTPWAEDYDLWLRAYQGGIAMAKPEGVLLRWRDRPQRLSRIDPAYSLPAFTRARAHFLAQTVLRRRPAVIWGAAPTGAALCDALVAEGVTVTGFIDIDPRKIGGRKRGRPVLAPPAAARIDRELILGAVGARGARGTIRAALAELGKREGRDFLFAA